MRLVICSSAVGNLDSVRRAVAYVADRDPRIHGVTTELSAEPETIRCADALIVPGQGSFGALAAELGRGAGEAIREHVRRGAPYLGICLGLQILFATSDEAPDARGLGLLDGHVHKLAPGVDETGATRKLPHMGWNTVAVPPPPTASTPPSRFAGGSYYFVHSYAVAPVDRTVVAGVTDYGTRFVSAVRQDNLTAVQFHPEKSQRDGLAFLADWVGGIGRS